MIWFQKRKQEDILNSVKSHRLNLLHYVVYENCASWGVGVTDNGHSVAA